VKSFRAVAGEILGTLLASTPGMNVRGVKSVSVTRRVERLRCVVVESGAPLLVESGATSFDETIVIAETPGEAPSAFAQRFAERLAQLERTGRHPESVVVLVGSGNDPETTAARRRMVTVLSSHARAQGALSELTLITEHHRDAEQQAELFALAEAVTALPNAELMPVRVRFGQGTPEPRRVA
jgi:hypothetical protein